MSLAISWLCWNSAQSIFRTARSSPKRTSAAVSTRRVFPEPVGPKKQQVRKWPARSGKTGLVDLEDAGQAPHGAILPDHAAAKGSFEVLHLGAMQRWIEDHLDRAHRGCSSYVPRFHT